MTNLEELINSGKVKKTRCNITGKVTYEINLKHMSTSKCDEYITRVKNEMKKHKNKERM
jgi:hypothetical protein